MTVPYGVFGDPGAPVGAVQRAALVRDIQKGRRDAPPLRELPLWEKAPPPKR